MAIVSERDKNEKMTLLLSPHFRGNEWAEFAKKVIDHVNNYSINQYGDFPVDQTTKFTPEECMSSIQRYVSRFGKNARDGQEELDLMKIAHYACIIWSKKYGPVSKLEIPKEIEKVPEFQEITLNGIVYEIREKK